MGVICQILVNKTPEGIYRPGQAVTGIVKYTIDKDTEYKKVTLSFLGTGKCAWIKTVGFRNIPYYGNEHYLAIQLILLDTQKTLKAGVYECPFKFDLPENLPSSYKDDISRIAYKIEMVFEKPEFFTINKRFRTLITVQGYVEPKEEGPVVFGLEKTFQSLFSEKKNMILKAEVAKSCVVPDESFYLKITVTNNTKMTPTIKTEIYCFTRYEANSGDTKKSNKIVKECCSDHTEVAANTEVSISQVVPTTSSLYSINTRVILKEYRLRVTLSFPAGDAEVEMPVVIGNRKGMPLVYAGTSEKEGTSASSMAPERHAPPSYWEVMSEVKKNSLFGKK